MATLIKTDTAGWYDNPETGKKARKQDGDTVVDRATYQRMQEQTGTSDNGGDPAPTASSESVVMVKLDTGTEVPESQTVVIRCSYIEDGNKDAKPYDTIKVGDKTIRGLSAAEKEKACGQERRIKKQDQFQVRFCTEHQKEHRKRIRREKLRRKRAAARASS